MCGYQARQDAGFSQSISISMPERSVVDVRSIIIGCCEWDSLPEIQQLERLKPIAFLTTSGGKLFDSNDECANSLRFLESVLTTAPDLEHIIVCLHTGCSFVCTDTECSGTPGRLRLLRNTEENISTSEPEEYADERSLRPYEQQLLEQLRAIAMMLDRNPDVTTKSIMLHGWLFEPEIEWISFFDLDTGLLLPLNAHTDLCSS